MSDVFVVVCSYVDRCGNRRDEIKASCFSLASVYDIASRWRRRLNSFWDVQIVNCRCLSVCSIHS